MADAVRLARLLRGVTDDVAFLERESDADRSRRSDPMWLRGIKYTFVTAIEGCVDVAQHLCATRGWGPPDDNGHAMRLLGEHRVMPAELAGEMAAAAGFRKVLVHDYITVDDQVVVDRLEDLSDLRAFVAAVADRLREAD